VISGNSASSTTINGTIDTPNPTTVTIELFSNNAADASGFGEGQIFQGTATPNASGNFTAILSGGLNFDAKHLPSGVYFAVLKVGEARQVRRVLLMK